MRAATILLAVTAVGLSLACGIAYHLYGPKHRILLARWQVSIIMTGVTLICAGLMIGNIENYGLTPNSSAWFVLVGLLSFDVGMLILAANLRNRRG